MKKRNPIIIITFFQKKLQGKILYFCTVQYISICVKYHIFNMKKAYLVLSPQNKATIKMEIRNKLHSGLSLHNFPYCVKKSENKKHVKHEIEKTVLNFF